MDFKSLINKAKDALGKNPGAIDKAGDFVDGKTGGKYAGQIDKAQEAAKKATGGQQPPAGQPAPGGEPTPPPAPGQ